MLRRFIFAAGFVVTGCSSAEPEPAAAPKAKAVVVTSEQKIAALDQHIKGDAWKPLTRQKDSGLYRKLGKERFADANALAMWAGRSALQDMCREVKSIKVSSDATRSQLSWDIKCDQTLGISVSEKGALQTRNAVDPSFKDRGESLPDMYSRSGAGEGADVEKLAATIINLNRHLCAKVLDISPLQMREGVYEVTCIEYRGGTGTVRYMLDARAGLASPL
ncbi:hypothetical protein [Sphingomonas sp.]|jgi:hypothetical protein|uniref:hypothetical protein n=1 Tax=Sphingomonas sp. TaxID=28214 RepID=UPI002601B91F|nr:hypothetical protein [Sphingomonas sp.]MDF2496066.1 hypothetical protein [Sphingomonas sp.]